MKHLFLLAATLCFASPSVWAEPENLLRDASLFGRFESLVARIDMEIHDRGVKSRTLDLYVEQNDDEHRAFVQVVAPAFLNHMKFLTIGDTDRVDQWISTSRGVRRIAESTRDERLFDSDFVVGDFMVSRSSEYEVGELPDESVEGERCHVIELVPLGVETAYTRRVVFLSVADRILVRAEYYSNAGELIRLFELHERTVIDGAQFPMRGTMHTLTNETRTEIIVGRVATDVEIPTRIFSRGNL